jgi:formylglycine-generating enzyme required for sulfatase activity
MVIKISWFAADHAEWLFQQIDKRYRLPTEAEREYTAPTRTRHWLRGLIRP